MANEVKKRREDYTKMILKSTRNDFFSNARQSMCDQLLDEVNNLTIQSTKNKTDVSMNLEEDSLIPPISYLSHSIRLIPRGREYKIVSNRSSITIQDKKTLIKKCFPVKAQSFECDSIYDIRSKTFWVVNVVSFKSFNYKNVNPKVAKFLQSSHFPSGLIYQNERLKIRILPDIPYSFIEFLSIFRTNYNFMKYIDIVPCGNTELENFRVFSKSYFFNKSARILLSMKEGILSTADNYPIPIKGKEPLTDEGVYEIIFKYRDVKKMKDLVDFISKINTEREEKQSFEEEFEIEPFSVKLMKKKSRTKGHKLCQLLKVLKTYIALIDRVQLSN
jgi:hypothetical protein